MPHLLRSFRTGFKTRRVSNKPVKLLFEATAQNSRSSFWTTFWILRLLGFPVHDPKQDAQRHQPQIFFPVLLRTQPVAESNLSMVC